MIFNLTAMAVAFSFAAIAYQKNILTAPASILAVLFASIVIAVFGLALSASILVCFAITIWLTIRHARFNIKRNAKVKVKISRDAKQVLANGLLLVLLAIGFAFQTQADLAYVAATLACTAAVAGDTWATEAAPTTRQRPRLLTNFQPVATGTPGAVSGIGLLITATSGLVAALVFLLVNALIAEMINPMLADTERLLVFDLTASSMILLTLAAMSGGFFGSLADSLLGARFQGIYRTTNGKITDNFSGNRINEYLRGWKWLSNNWVNFASSVVGAAIGYLVWWFASF